MLLPIHILPYLTVSPLPPAVPQSLAARLPLSTQANQAAEFISDGVAASPSSDDHVHSDHVQQAADAATQSASFGDTTSMDTAVADERFW